MVSPGSRRKLTIAFASAGTVLSSTPPLDDRQGGRRAHAGVHLRVGRSASASGTGRTARCWRRPPAGRSARPCQSRGTAGAAGAGASASDGLPGGPGRGQDADGGLGRRGGRMPRLAMNGELHRQVALFAHADQRHRAAHAGRQAGDDPAAFVDDPGQADAAFLEHLPHHLAAIDAAGLLVMSQAEKDGALRAGSPAGAASRPRP